MAEIKNVFGVDADDKSLQSKQSGVFGLNTGFLTKLAYTEEQNEEKNFKAVDMTVQINDREYFNRFFINDSVYGPKGELLNPGDEGYDAAFFDNYSQIVAVIKHGLGALGVTKEAINAALAGIDNTKLLEGMQKLVALVPAGFQNKPVDIFLEYQWNIPDGKDRTYLTLPKNMKGGEFLHAAVTPAGKWTEVRTEDGLHYVDDSGVKHPFEKNKSFMESNKAIQQGVGASPAAGAATPVQAAQKSTWE